MYTLHVRLDVAILYSVLLVSATYYVSEVNDGPVASVASGENGMWAATPPPQPESDFSIRSKVGDDDDDITTLAPKNSSLGVLYDSPKQASR